MVTAPASSFHHGTAKFTRSTAPQKRASSSNTRLQSARFRALAGEFRRSTVVAGSLHAGEVRVVERFVE